MDKPAKTLDDNTKRTTLLPKKSLLNWEPDENLKKVIFVSFNTLNIKKSIYSYTFRFCTINI